MMPDDIPSIVKLITEGDPSSDVILDRKPVCVWSNTGDWRW